jgi:meso-butanediol dehydrogenase/(S,S)-butanediol dehydrogenase/diacetyl reductase
MTKRLAGKVAIVTGSTRGIGRSIAEYFAAEGAKVVVTGRTVEKGRKVVDRIREAGGEAHFLRLDVTDEDSVRGVMDAAAERYGSLSTLINNAAPTDIVASTFKPLAEYTTDEWNRIMTGTLTGNVFWSSKYAWPHLVKADGPSVVNISSGASIAGFKGLGAYGAAKGGVNSLTRTLAVEGAESGIRANCIITGRVVTSPRDSDLHTGGGRLTRLGVPMDIAYAAAWLASDESAFITGTMITADGGFSANGDATAAATG